MYVLRNGSEAAKFRDLELLAEPMRESTTIPPSHTGHSCAVGKEIALDGTHGARLR
jgi:hypothetical protein